MNTGLHPSAETLGAFASHRLGGNGHEVLDHLLECPSCARIVLDFRGLVRDPDPEMDQFWTRFRANHGPPVESGARPSNDLPTSWFPAAALGAAAMLVVLGGLAIWNALGLADARRELAAAQVLLDQRVEPQINLPTADVLPWTSLRGAGEPAVLDFGERSRSAVLRLVLLDQPASGSLSLEVLDSSGRRAARLTGLEVNINGNLTMAVPRQWLEPGRYVLRLSSSEASSEVLAEYRLLVRSSEQVSQ